MNDSCGALGPPRCSRAEGERREKERERERGREGEALCWDDLSRF